MGHKEKYPFDTREHLEREKPYGPIDIIPGFFEEYKEERKEALKYLDGQEAKLKIPSRSSYSDKEIDELQIFDTIKMIRTLYSRHLDSNLMQHFWRILKKAELRRLTASYDNRFMNLSHTPANIEAHAILALTLGRYAQTMARGYLQALSTALKQNDFLVSEIEHLHSPLEIAAAKESLELEETLINSLSQRMPRIPYPNLELPRIYQAKSIQTIKNLGMLAQESDRTKAYLQAMVLSGFLPNFVLLISSPDHTRESRANSKKERAQRELGFNHLASEVKSLDEAKIPYKMITASSCNEPGVVSELLNRDEKYFVYSGREILKEPFKSGKEFIHVHPGKLPEYRGSTCHFYSVLAGDGWHCTSFIMTPEIDRGEIITTREFPLPGRGIDDSRSYDPYSRSVVLVDTLKQLAETKTLKTRRQEFNKGVDYFVIHPVLRYIRAKYLNNAPPFI